MQDPFSDLDHLGPYRLEGVLGQGGMGTVRAATDTRNGRPVALKALSLADVQRDSQCAERALRFAREVEWAQALQHPDVLAVYDSGVDAPHPHRAPIAWMAMERLSGHTLDAFLNPPHRLAVHEVLHVAARVARVLAHAHRLGVVHRDVKPENIALDRARGVVKLIDFGVAQHDDHSQTQTGVFLGSPSYMAPEQLAGRPVDGRADLYALGVTVYQLLTGHLPFESDSLSELLRQIAQAAPIPIAHWRHDLPPGLWPVLALCLEKSPDVRAVDGDSLALEFEGLLAGLPSSSAAS